LLEIIPIDWLCALSAETPVKRDPNRLMILSSVLSAAALYASGRRLPALIDAWRLAVLRREIRRRPAAGR
jgi:hypothetical protein